MELIQITKVGIDMQRDRNCAKKVISPLSPIQVDQAHDDDDDYNRLS